MDIRKVLGRNIKEIRKSKGLSQEALAFEVELNRTYISGIERGLRNPTLSVLDRLSKVLSVHPRDLLK